MNPQGYEVHLEIFEGPLDLLLFLIRENDLDIHDIPISEITREYLSYLDLMKDLNLEVAGDFLVMAASLMQIKARTLLPSHESESQEEGPDPRQELVAKLVEYQKYKEAARFLEARAERFKDVFYRGAPHFTDDQKTLNLSLFDLLGTLREILDSAAEGRLSVQGEAFPVEEKMLKIQDLLESRPFVTFRELFQGETRRAAILSCFLALLELIKLGRVFARQEGQFSDIYVYKSAVPAGPSWPEAGADAGPFPGSPPESTDEVNGNGRR